MCEELTSITSKAVDILDDMQTQLDHNEKNEKEERERQDRKEEQERQDRKEEQERQDRKEEQERQDRLTRESEERKLQLTKVQMEEETKRIQINEETKRLQVEEETKRMQEQLRKDLESEKLSSEETRNRNQNNFTPTVMSAKLPKLQLPKFDGTFLKWQEFWDSFTVAIHDNPSLKPVDKLNYLKCSLEGKAKQALEGLQVINENYDVAVKLLQDRFGDKGRVVKAHYNVLTEIPTSTNDPMKLQSTYDKIEKSIRSLEALGENVESNLLVCLIKTKLPEETMFKLEEHKNPDESWSVSLLRKYLQWYITTRVSAHEDSGQSFQSSITKKNQPKPHQYATTEGLFVGDGKKPTRNCIFCNGSHWNDECFKFKTIQARKGKIKGRCFTCFNKDHRSNNCQSKKKCFHCKKESAHHSSLCPDKFPIGKIYQEGNTNSQGELAQMVQETSVEVPLQEGSLLAYGERVFMQTAKTFIQNPQMPSHMMELRLMMDCGSHRSYISSSLANKLHLKLGKKEKIAILTFGSSVPTVIDTQMTNLQLKLKDGSFFKIKVHVVPKVSGIIERIPMNVQRLKNVLNKYSLADTIPQEAESTQIELLIGNDYYGDLLLPKKVFLAPGLNLINSKLGWILSGRIKQDGKRTNESGLLCIDSVNFSKQSEMTFATDDSQLSSLPKLDEFWQLETLGIKESIDHNDDEQALQNFNDTVQYEDGRYYVTWPWKEECNDLPDNYNLSKGRLKSTVNRLKVDKELLQKYDGIVRAMILLTEHTRTNHSHTSMFS
jgi:hypothetical protein